ncbi:polysaccharide lyase family 4, domain III-domain-containing protein [Pseudomassariella vexata]|uniref:rhamnogalacturonan endolyase n=1 Tax=Pseudomassariella vexata TaxID=1141098 RepID=A0A1Y2E1F7_9PEZI|nr:polysaccharide lyase family 4, domain III-domain-containing protein [Pseudomassariella vexata]ORY65174.1 polysaccharide lyase family 4, domain III-domain-containing protein [Pseudomassariella vexata]
MRGLLLGGWAFAASLATAQRGPFLEQIDDTTWVVGNDLWNLTQGAFYATKLFHRGQDLVGSAVGHYVGYDGEDNLQWLSASIAAEGDNFIDVSFFAELGDFHWVIFDDLPGAYQYFVNRALPDISILRSLWRLAPEIFLNGRTHLKNEALPDFALYANATNVQDETWQLEDGTFITKYDWSNAVRDRDFYGVYGPEFGSWYIHPTFEYYNSDQLSQTLTVHRESSTGDSVQLNVVQDTSHFRVGQTTAQPEGKTWGPWLWYLNSGSIADAAERRVEELAGWPYEWFNNTSYHSRGGVSGYLQLSDGRPAAGAAVYLGDTDTTIRPSIQGSNYYYTTYADDTGAFSFDDVRTGSYGLYAWSNGGEIGDVYTNVTTSPVTITRAATTQLGELKWDVPSGAQRIFQVGEFDKKALGFTHGGPPYQHGVADLSPANLTFVDGESENSDWYYAQSAIGKWTIEFDLAAEEVTGYKTALLSVSLAGYSQSAALDIDVNGQVLATLSKDTLVSDPALYRSGKTNGEWRFFQYPISSSMLSAGVNTVGFTVTRYTQWRGFMWDSIILDWE